MIHPYHIAAGRLFGTLLVAGLVAPGASGCGDGDRAATARDAGARPALSADAATVFRPCDGQDDGERCGPERHCVAGRCLINLCGDGVVAGDEVCDDGNQASDDDCTPSCLRPRGRCGDGMLDPSEECDDGNGNDGDFCTNTCLRQLCRNGVLDPSEECDDGNTNPHDGCSNECQRIVCGDGMAEEQEECDDGNTRDDDDCSNLCTRNACNNGRVDPGEVCDGRLQRSENGAPEGEPIGEGLNCAQDCRSIVDDRCKKCQEEQCPAFAREAFSEDADEDMLAGCYTVGYRSKVSTLGRTTTDADVTKCSALMECIRRNRCDLYAFWSPERPTHDVNLRPDPEIPLTWGSLEGCLCGEVAPGSGTWFYEMGCTDAPAGTCVQQIYDATDCTSPGCVEGSLVIEGSASYYANYLAMCHRLRCFDACR